MSSALLSLAVNAVSTIASMGADAQRASAEREARKIGSANEQLRNRDARRKAIREERVRRQQIAQASVNTGVSGSSGEIGSAAALASSVGRNIAFQQQETLAAQGISKQNQKAANAKTTMNNISSLTDLFQTGIDTYEAL